MAQAIYPNFDSLSMMMSQSKNTNWYNFSFKRDFHLRVFFKVIYFEVVSAEKIKLHTFSGVQHHFKNCSSDICGWRFSLHFLKILGFLRFIFLYFSYLKKKCMEKVYKYYETPSSEDSYRVRVDTASQNNLTKLPL